ncbi:ANXA7-like protein [Mya arenaria]|uniref:ANXA7-like protein n=1 Tax=Mya arenaria TaxID=6604 RepID=A0ABY7FLV5_MYAAR|nr:ANXA7-like protein [Mya arenaria]
MATVRGDFVFTEEEEKQAAEKLKDAMDGLGTNEEAIVEVLVNHNNEQRQKIKGAYAAAYGKPLVDDLISELTGDLEETIVALMMTPRELDAKLLHDAISGIGTEETMLIGVLCTKTNDEIDAIKEAYKKLYDADLNEEIQSDTSGYFRRLMFSLVSGKRQEGMADYDRAHEEAQKLIDAGVNQLGTDECDFNAVLCLSSHEQLQCVFQKYEELREGCTIEDDIKSEVDLEYIKSVFEQKYEKTLYETVDGECSGYYKRCLLSLIVGKYVAPE